MDNQTMNTNTNQPAQMPQPMSASTQPPKMSSASNSSDKKENRRTIMIVGAILVLLIGLIAGFILLQEPQTTQRSAAEPTPPVSCPLNAFKCKWDKEEGVSYTCAIYQRNTDGTRGSLLENPTVQDDPDNANGNICYYQPVAGESYICEVTAEREPGCTASAEGYATCPLIPPTETPTPSPTVTPSPTPTPNPLCYVTQCDPDVPTSCSDLGLPGHYCVDTDKTNDDTQNPDDYRCILNQQCATPNDGAACWCYAPTPTPTPTPSPTVTPSATPTPNPSATVTPTPTPNPSATVTPTTNPSATATPVPTTVTSTPSPTDFVVVNSTATPTSVQVAENPAVTATTAPTLPVAGAEITLLFLIVGAIVTVIGLVL